MMTIIVTKKVLEIYDKYDGDFGLMDERWADKKDLENITSEQMQLFGEYLDNLGDLNVDRLSHEFRERIEKRIVEIESLIDPDVISEMRKRMVG